MPVVAVDKNDNIVRQELSIANTESAIVYADPVLLDDIDVNNLLAVTGTSATVTLKVVSQDAGVPVVRYCEEGTENWLTAEGTASGNVMTFRLTGLKTGTRYEYQAAVDDFVSESKYFTTEEAFAIPNASFESWNTYSAKTMLGTKNVIIPWAEGDKSASFWGSGNEGAATANKVLTDKSADMVNSGSYCARLASDEAARIIAAGNIFVGEYVETDVTNGVLSVGRPYNGSHPVSLRFYANYRPASGVTVKSGNEAFVPEGFKGGLTTDRCM